MTESLKEKDSSKFSIDDIATTLEYLQNLAKKDPAWSLGTNLEPSNKDWSGESYKSWINDRKFQFSDKNFQEATDNVIDAWEKNSEGFKSIFETENGSKYFVLEDGKIIRFKKKNGNWDALEQIKVMEHIVFLEQGTYDMLLKSDANRMLQEEIFELTTAGIPIKLEPQVGLYPFEFKLYRYGNPIEFTTENNLLKINNNSGPFASGYHFGHKITRVIKS